MTATEEPAPAAKPPGQNGRPPKPPPAPRFRVGEFVATRFTVVVRHQGVGRRRRLFLLPGCRWEVVSVYQEGRRKPRYTLRTNGVAPHVEKPEWVLRPAGPKS